MDVGPCLTLVGHTQEVSKYDYTWGRNYLRAPTSNNVTVRLKEMKHASVLVATCHPWAWEGKAGRPGRVPGPLQLHGEFEANLDFDGPCLRKINK